MTEGRRGRRRKAENQGLPKGVYRLPNGSYMFRSWVTVDGNTKQTHHGVVSDPYEAHYKKLVIDQGHHWEGFEHDPEGSWGFVYCITNRRTGRMYIGKKQYRLWNATPGGYKCTDPKDPWFDESLWKENDWQFYSGSSKYLDYDLDAGKPWEFKFEVLGVYQNALDLHLAEIFEQKDRDVLEALDANGEYQYYNRNIGGVEYRAPFLKAEVLAARKTTRRAAKLYYLRPRYCRNCKTMLPYPGNFCEVCG